MTPNPKLLARREEEWDGVVTCKVEDMIPAFARPILLDYLSELNRPLILIDEGVTL